MKEILITGSSGKVGSAVVRELAPAGETVRAATRNAASVTVTAGVEPVHFDYTDTSTFANALAGADRVFLLEPQPPLGIAADRLMIPLVKVAADARCKIVLLSSASVAYDDSEPLRAVELAVERSGRPFVILRANWFMDNFHTLWRDPIREAGLLPLPAGEAKSAFIDTRDVGAAVAVALRNNRFDGRILTITGPEPLSYAEAGAALGRATGREIRYVPIDDASFSKSLLDAGLPPDFVEYVTGLFRLTRQGISAKVTTDAEMLMGCKPRTLDEYARDHREAWI
jgi:uncharacterized protein YbjT (DUF2867 family)